MGPEKCSPTAARLEYGYSAWSSDFRIGGRAALAACAERGVKAYPLPYALSMSVDGNGVAVGATIG